MTCGVDIGSTNIKVVAIDADGVVVARASRPTPRDADGLSIAGRTLLEAIEALVTQTCGDRYAAHAICCAGVGEDGLLVDDALRPLTSALAWFDPRRQSVFRELRASLTQDETFDAATDPARAMIGWAWALREPRASAARKWIALADLPIATWCGRPFLSDTLASRTGAWRSGDRTWAVDRVRATLGPDLLPPVVPVGAIIGEIKRSSLAQSGALASDAIAVAGGHDHPIGGWIVDQMAPGTVLDSMGTAEVVVVQSRSPISPNDDVDIAPGIRSTGTTVLRVEELARNIAWASQDPAVAASIRALLAGSAPAGRILDAGYFVPGRRGGGSPSYSLDAPREPQARAAAVLSALAHSGAQAVEAVRREVGVGPSADDRGVRLAGGWSRSPGWIAIKAAISGYRAEPIAEPEVTAVGAAFMAATARGWHPDPSAALAGTPVDPRV